MKITNIKVIGLRYPYANPIMDGCNTCNRREAFLVKVETDTEIEGIGEAATFGLPLSAFKETAENAVIPLLIGQDPLKTEFLYERLLRCCWAGGRKGIVRGVASAVDIALWDIKGKACNMPVYKLLGANADKVNTYASAGFYSPGKTVDKLKEEFEGYVDRGYKAFKMKVGRTWENFDRILQYMPAQKEIYSMKEDMERVRTVRSAIGDENVLMLDMNNTWDVKTVMEQEDFLNEMKIYAIEEPIDGTDIQGYKKIGKNVKNVLRAGGENEQGTERYKQILEENMLDLVQANIGWTGGITEVKRIADLCVTYNKLFAPHTFFSAVLTAANIHVAASLPNVPFIESEENENPLRDQLLKQPFERDKDMAYVLTDKPGLGIELNMETIEKYHV